MRPGIAALIVSLARGIIWTPLAAEARRLVRRAPLGIVFPLAPSLIETCRRGRPDRGYVEAQDQG